MSEALPRLQVRRRVDDTESPVSAVLKLGPLSPGVVLFESVMGGENRGRYSFVGLNPDLWWRVRDGRAETARDAGFTDIVSTSDQPLTDMRRFIDACRADGLEGLPPMAAGAFGYVGYDMIRHMEAMPDAAPDPNGVPEAMLMRPSVVLIFDGVRQEIILAAPERGGADEAGRRLDEIEARLDQPMPAARPTSAPVDVVSFTSNVTRERYLEMVGRARDYIRAGDIFQVVPSQRFSAAFCRSPFAFYRSLRRLNPSPFMFYVNFGSFQISGSSPEILVRLRGGVGYFGAGGDMDTCIALRTAVFKDGRIHVQAGGGVVFDSDPQKEFEETVHKASALFRAAEEASRYDAGAGRGG